MNNDNLEFLYRQIATEIDISKRNVILAVNSEMVILYWSIGKIIKTEILKSERLNMENQ